MTFLTFPSPAIEGDKYTFGNITYQYTSGAWNVLRTGFKLDRTTHTPMRTQFLRDATDAGFNLVSGSFEEGATVSNYATDVVLSYTQGKIYQSTTNRTIVGSTTTPDGTWIDVTSTLSSMALKNRMGSSGTMMHRNKIIDGIYNIWYEGTTQTTSGYGSNTMVSNRHSGSTKTVTRQTLDSNDLPKIDVPTATYFQRTVVVTAGTATSYTNQVHIIANANTLAGKYVTFSFYAKSDAARKIFVDVGQYFGAAGSALVNNRSSAITLSTTWQRYSYTCYLPSVSGKTFDTSHQVYATIYFEAGSSVDASLLIGNQSGTFDIACAQLEEGTIASPFEELSPNENERRVNIFFERGRLKQYVGTNTGTTAYISSTFFYKSRKYSTPSVTFWGDGYAGTYVSQLLITDTPTYATTAMSSVDYTASTDASYLMFIEKGTTSRTLIGAYFYADCRL